MRRAFPFALVTAILLLAVGGVVTIARVRSGGARAKAPRTVALSCRSPSLGGTLPAKVYLPANYAGGHRYRVIYFLHGLPADPDSYIFNDFVADAAASGPEQAIVVAPQGARSQGSDREYLDQGPDENWPRAIASDLTRCVEERFSTIAGRAGRTLVGLSAGGYGAFNIGLRNLRTFGAVESWSGYFEATDPSGWHILNLGSPQANASARVPRGTALARALARYPTFIGFYVGRQDARFLADNRAFNSSLTAAHIRHLFRVYPGGHSGSLWGAQAATWLGYALHALEAGI